MNSKPIYNQKLVLLGNSSVGKSSILLRYIRNKFVYDQNSTIGASFYTSKIELDECIIKFDIWDTAGQERYHSLAPLYYKGAAVIFVVFDVTNNSSFAQAKNWISELKRLGPENVLILLIGNKIDIVLQNSESIKVSQDIINEIVNTNNNIKYIETSAKINHNIDYIFKYSAEEIYKIRKDVITNSICKINNKENRADCCYIM